MRLQNLGLHCHIVSTVPDDPRTLRCHHVLAVAACTYSVQGIKYSMELDNEATGLLRAENELGSVHWETMTTEDNA